ncbi:hypothetical protein [Streptosporangium sp. LJ11]|uniref:hypothetical protein n=1 Tax=Streptosporangium sp. LJ11 TaxID=3436927 RepID=UPI003F795CA0
MRRSRVGSVVIDRDDFAAGVAFWSAALDARPESGDGRWASIAQAASHAHRHRRPWPTTVFSRGESGQAQDYA